MRESGKVVFGTKITDHFEAYISSIMKPISSNVLGKLRHLESHLRDHIKGQDHVIPRICSVLQRGELNLAHTDRPKGSFLFVGPMWLGGGLKVGMFCKRAKPGESVPGPLSRERWSEGGMDGGSSPRKAGE